MTAPAPKALRPLDSALRMDRPSALIYGSRTLEASHRLLAEGYRPAVILQVDAEVPRALVPEGTRVWDWDAVHTEQDQAAIGAQVQQLMTTWYRLGGEDVSVWNGYSLGACYTGPRFANRVTPVLINLLVFQRVCEAFGVRHFVLGYGTGAEPGTWQRAASRNGMACERLEFDAELRQTASAAPAPRVSRRRWLGIHLASCVQSAVGALRRHRQRGRPTVLIASDSLLHRMPWIARDLRASRAVEVVEARHVLPRFQRTRILRAAAASAAPALADRWDALAAQHGMSSLFTWGGVSWWPLVASWMQREFCERLPQAAGVTAHAEAVLRRTRPACILTEAQVGNEEACWAAAARRCGIPVVAQQNEIWIPEHPPHAYYPAPVADYVLTGSPLARSWFLRKGYEPAQVIPVEDPRIRGAREARRVRSGKGLAPRRPRVLFAAGRTEPLEFSVSGMHNRRVLRAVLGAARAHSDLDFFVKLHPRMDLADGPGAAEDYLRVIAEAD
ncbi:MAG: hypothetical protein R3247_14385, partial [Rhodothermales bacterium]|nr:hypothetical protein [Rhodothermales bacterium]